MSRWALDIILDLMPSARLANLIRPFIQGKLRWRTCKFQVSHEENDISRRLRALDTRDRRQPGIDR